MNNKLFTAAIDIFFTQIKIRKIVKITLYVSIFVFVITAFKKDELPHNAFILKELYQEPKQTDTSALPFMKQVRGIEYNITPVHGYELYGLVVSYHHSNVFWDCYHSDSKDFINAADICVIWGKNIETEVYKKMKFTSGSWTCYPEFAAGATQENFSKYCPECLSNNHLLAENDDINKQIMRVQKGDQIYIKGYLANYSQKDWGSFQRTSSTTRTDNLCEVIFVKEFRILRKTNYLWRIMHDFTKYLIFVCVLFFVAKFFRFTVQDV
jgi:hypothetical protein